MAKTARSTLMSGSRPDYGRRGGAVMMTVVTPAGHAYTSSWGLLLVDGPPDIRAHGGDDVRLDAGDRCRPGRPYAVVAVAGSVVALDEDGRFSTSVEVPPWPAAITVTARDPLGNEATSSSAASGSSTTEGLPWLPIALVLLGGVAVALFFRVPKPRSATRSVGDDAILEEIDQVDKP